MAERALHAAGAAITADESKRFQELFHAYNHRYFGGRLPPYRVRVVYDVNYWADEYFSNGYFLEPPSSGYHDQARRTIFLRYGDLPLEAVLVHEMEPAKAVLIGAQGIGQYESISAVILGDGDSVTVAKAIRIDGEHCPLMF